MKKSIILLISFLFVMIGCAGFQLTDNATTNAMAYASGKGMGIAINTIVPEVDADLSQAYKDLMARNTGVTEIPADQMVLFYNDCLSKIALHTSDPYGLVQDMGVFMGLFGAQFNSDGNLIGIKPVPVITMDYFGMGYRNGRLVALR